MKSLKISTANGDVLIAPMGKAPFNALASAPKTLTGEGVVDAIAGQLGQVSQYDVVDSPRKVNVKVALSPEGLNKLREAVGLPAKAVA